MLRIKITASRTLRACVVGLAATAAATLVTSTSAEARRHRHSRHSSHQARQSESYNPQFSSIIVDGNSGATLSSNSPDGLRHPASLTKIMTLYLLFERLEAGKMKLDSEMQVSEHASEQSPTKLGLRPGQTIAVEDAIKGLVTRSANDAAVVIAEAIGGDEEDFAKLMTRKARALGMTRTVYRNASGLPNDEQVTTARDQATLGRAIQDRFPRYYRFFSTSVFNYHGHPIRNHNRLLGSVEGVDGIKTGYTRASGFNLVTSMRRGNRHLVGVVMGGRSGGSRDATMRSLLAENVQKASTMRTVAAITERSVSEANAEVAEEQARARPTQTVQVQGAMQVASAADDETPPMRPRVTRPLVAAATAAIPPTQPRIEPPLLSSGVIHNQLAAIPGSSEPMKPVRVKTLQVRAGQNKVASAGSLPSVAMNTASVSRPAIAETSNSVVARAETRVEPVTEMPPQPANHGTGHGVLGVLPASSVQSAPPARAAFASVEPAGRQAPAAIQQNGAIKPAISHTGWIIQVGALESEGEAKLRLDAARSQARGMLGNAESFTETVSKGDRMLYRARFAGLDRDRAEAVCKTLKRSDISCITIRN